MTSVSAETEAAEQRRAGAPAPPLIAAGRAAPAPAPAAQIESSKRRRLDGSHDGGATCAAPHDAAARAAAADTSCPPPEPASMPPPPPPPRADGAPPSSPVDPHPSTALLPVQAAAQGPPAAVVVGTPIARPNRRASPAARTPAARTPAQPRSTRRTPLSAASTVAADGSADVLAARVAELADENARMSHELARLRWADTQRQRLADRVRELEATNESLVADKADLENLLARSRAPGAVRSLEQQLSAARAAAAERAAAADETVAALEARLAAAEAGQRAASADAAASRAGRQAAELALAAAAQREASASAAERAAALAAARAEVSEELGRLQTDLAKARVATGAEHGNASQARARLVRACAELEAARSAHAVELAASNQRAAAAEAAAAEAAAAAAHEQRAAASSRQQVQKLDGEVTRLRGQLAHAQQQVSAAHAPLATRHRSDRPNPERRRQRQIIHAQNTLREVCGGDAELIAETAVRAFQSYGAARAIAAHVYGIKHAAVKSTIDFFQFEVFAARRLADFFSISKVSGRLWDWQREFIFRRYDPATAENGLLTVLKGEHGLATLRLKPYVSAAGIKSLNEKEAAENGLSIAYTENGRVASVDTVAAAHNVLRACDKKGACARPTGAPRLLVGSSDAGTVANKGKQRDWTSLCLRCAHRCDGNCCPSAVQPVGQAAYSDKNSGLSAGWAPHVPLFDFIARYGLLPCCVARLDVALHLDICPVPDAPAQRARSSAAAAAAPAPAAAAAPAPAPAAPTVPAGALPDAFKCGCEHPGFEPCDFVYTGDLANLVGMMGLGSHRTDPAKYSIHKVKLDDGTWAWRTVADAMLYSHSLVGKRCPCGWINHSDDDVEGERDRRIHMPSGQAKSDELHVHKNYWLRPVLWVEFDHYLLGVMHFCHNTFDQWFGAVWKDVDTLHEGDANFVKYDLVAALVSMGVTCLKPARRDGNEVAVPSFKGADLSLMRTELGMLMALQIVYGVADFFDGEGEGEAGGSDGAIAASAANVEAVEHLEAQMRERRRLRGGSSSNAQAAARAAREPALRRACAALMALWEVQRLVKDTSYDDSTEQSRRAHAAAYRTAFEDFVTKLKAMTSKDVQSQYITEGLEVMPDLIERWGKVVAYVNEQVQEHMVKLTKDFARRASDHSIELGSYVAHLASGASITRNRRSTAVGQVLRRQCDALCALERAAQTNKTAHQKLAGSKRHIAHEDKPAVTLEADCDQLWEDLKKQPKPSGRGAD